MASDTPLPSIRKLRQLADWGGPFPIQNKHLLLAAERFGFDNKVKEFLKVFPLRTKFQSRKEFVHQCEVLEQFLRAEQGFPDETLNELLDKHKTYAP